MERKSYAAVICEYNPFHFGHKYQMDELKKHFDGVVCIMSGNLVQRGSVAIADKYIRAEAALKSGADLVLELPIPWCCSSARDFATAGVYIAENIGVDYLAFGAEDSIELLETVYSLISKNEFEYEVETVCKTDKNISYPQAFGEVVRKKLGQVAFEAVKKPNNILALEYIKAIGEGEIKPFVVKRNPDYLSSSQIRSSKCGRKMLELLPNESKAVFEREMNKAFPREISKLDSFFIGTLRRIKENELENIYSTPKDLAKKIIQGAVKCSSIEELVGFCNDKTYTRARVRRSINSLVFKVESDSVKRKPPYTTVLALNKVGREILKKAKNFSEIDIINKPIRAIQFREETKNAFLFSKSVEDVIILSEPNPSRADLGKNPIIGE